MELLHRGFRVLIPFLAIVLLLGNGQKAEAKKYYSLKNIGLAGCATDRTDYGIISLRGNKMKYVIYKRSDNSCEWEQVGGVKTAKLTSATRYYMGDAQKVSPSLKNGQQKERDNGRTWTRQNDRKNRHITPKSIDTEQWICRVRKGIVKKNISGRNNEIRVARGKATKVVIRLSY